MKRNIPVVSIFFAILISLLSVNTSRAEDRWVCQDCDPLWTNTYSTISAAISAASPGDTIKIHAEVDPNSPLEFYEYQISSTLIVNKTLTITAPEEHETHGWPVIKLSTFSNNQEIIKITEAGSGSEISNLVIHGPTQAHSFCSTGDPWDCIDEKIGVHLQGEDCLIDNCDITFCMTGIYMESPTNTAGTGNVISNCQIGDRWWFETQPDEYIYEEYWSASGGGNPIVHPGNGFGIVLIAPTWTQQAGEIYKDQYKNEIVDCMIRSNRYYGIVLTNGSRANIAHNIIAWNGNDSVDASTSMSINTGGILSVFTDDQIAANDNLLQAPTIISNSIYGNKGYQIGIITEDDDLHHIYNSPVIMSNNIGVEDNMPVDPQDPEYEILISCGPTPDITPTITPAVPPENTPTPHLCDFSYDYHGSSAILAWNNLYDPSGKNLKVYHPLQKHNLPFNPTFTPTPAPAPMSNTPTPTAFATLPSPTGIPYIPTNTPVVTNTPRPKFHSLCDYSWSLKSQMEDPVHFGWTEDSNREPPRYYDWHCLDYEPQQLTGPTPTPNGEPSATPTPYSDIFDKGGINLNPGSSTRDMVRDMGFVDLGKHMTKDVPSVESFSAELQNRMIYLDWEIADYWPDGSVFQESEIGGFVIGLGIPPTSGHMTPVFIGNPIYLPSNIRETIQEPRPSQATHFGIYLYDVNGNESAIVWTEIPD